MVFGIASTDTVGLAITIELVVIIGSARVFSRLLHSIGQPPVCGEIVAGLVLGPSLFGRLFPRTFAAFFIPGAVPAISALSNLGLILLMFLIGLEFEFSRISTRKRAIASISLAGIAVPFAIGLAIAGFVYRYAGEGVSRFGFTLFFATALSITALPVLGRILVELDISRSTLGVTAITAAAVDDVTGWTLLAIVTAVVHARFQLLATAAKLTLAAAYVAAVIYFARPMVRWFANRRLHGDGAIGLGELASILIITLASASVTQAIGLHPIFGAFLAGAIFADHPQLRLALKARLEDFVTVFFLPIFFTFTGLRTDIGAMTSPTLWLTCGVVFAAAFAGKFGGCVAGAWLTGLSRREACAIGALMNTRGMVELVVINIGHDLGIVPQPLFFSLVVMAVASTLLSSPILCRCLRIIPSLQVGHKAVTIRWPVAESGEPTSVQSGA